ncbi:hypothetical protein [Myxococcus sp. AS-1-15]|uniref:hypothetical protein n=1 Tax=Myxococcus sp. AS-1-15 TaxID=2874600 RepID=UPI001CC0BA84|nr:hypothetical protein [Myxococcus sp. AS-1-15]MBZ4400404.1 hypothetical protein [Myxococcus sp. AS-1-15]
MTLLTRPEEVRRRRWRLALVVLLGATGAGLCWVALGPAPSWQRLGTMATGLAVFGAAVGLRVGHQERRSS